MATIKEIRAGIVAEIAAQEARLAALEREVIQTTVSLDSLRAVRSALDATPTPPPAS